MQAPVDIGGVLFVVSDDAVISSFLQLFLDDAKQDNLFWRGYTNQIRDFMHLGTVLDAVLDPDQVLHVADGTLQLR
jgi:hypothetical protein